MEENRDVEEALVIHEKKEKALVQTQPEPDTN
jgi:hypothetical protein